MNKKDTSGPAYPVVGVDGPRGKVGNSDGMSLRAYLAGQALIGIASVYHDEWAPERIGPVCCELADAVLAELAKNGD